MKNYVRSEDPDLLSASVEASFGYWWESVFEVLFIKLNISPDISHLVSLLKRIAYYFEYELRIDLNIKTINR